MRRRREPGSVPFAGDIGRWLRRRRRRRDGGFVEVQELAHHGLHLKFVGVAVACERLLDGGGRIFGQRQVCQGGGQQGGAACLADGDGGCYIASEEEFFDSDLMRLEFMDQLLDVEEDLAQAPGA